MKKIAIIIVLLVGINKSFSQVTDLEIIMKQNDTLKNVELKMNFFSKVELNYKLQEKLVISDNSGNKKELLPNDVSSFSFKHGDKTYNYESVENKIFAQPLYKNKLKLFRFIKSGYTSINFYIIERPNNGKISYMEATGLSKLISKKVISREITDCPITISKVENKELRINGEEGVIELIKDYEINCYK